MKHKKAFFGNQFYKPLPKKKTRFNPDHEEINRAVKDYFTCGGKITVIDELPEMKEYRDWQAIDEFLRGL